MTARPDPFTRGRQEWLERVQDHPNLGNSHLALAFAIGRHLNRTTGDAWPSQKTLASAIGVSARQVRTLLRDLENQGLLTTESGGFQRPDRYRPGTPERKLTSALNVEADFRSARPPERKLTSAQSGSGLPPNPLNEPLEYRPPNPPEGGVRQDRFAEGWDAYPIAGRANAGPAKASREWPGAAERAGGEEALIDAIKAHAARLASDGSKAKNFDRWLRDDGFAAYLRMSVAAPVSSWSGPADVWAEASRAMGEETVRTYLGRCGWQDSPVKAVIAPHEFAAGKLRSGAGAALASLGVQILVGEKAQLDKAAVWKRRIEEYRKNAYWNRLEWGPAPGRPGCTLPAEILMANGYAPARVGWV